MTIVNDGGEERCRGGHRYGIYRCRFEVLELGLGEGKGGKLEGREIQVDGGDGTLKFNEVQETLSDDLPSHWLELRW